MLGFMISRFAAVVIVTPLFLFPGFIVSVLGAFCGQLYIVGQLSIKRMSRRNNWWSLRSDQFIGEMSNLRAPIISHFGAAISGLSESRKRDLLLRSRPFVASLRAYGAQTKYRQESMVRIDRYTRARRSFYNHALCVRFLCK